jgi:putative transposase
LDFHHGSLRVLLANGKWVYPLLLGILDDHSRLLCHIQWYLGETAQELCHGLCQAFQRRQVPRSILYDNSSAMIAAETTQGLSRLSIVYENTLPFSPYYVASFVMWPKTITPCIHRVSSPFRAT